MLEAKHNSIFDYWWMPKETMPYDQIGDMISIANFQKANNAKSILPSDGCIGGVFIDGQPTNLIVEGWESYPAILNVESREVSLNDLSRWSILRTSIMIEWCNK